MRRMKRSCSMGSGNSPPKWKRNWQRRMRRSDESYRTDLNNIRRGRDLRARHYGDMDDGQGFYAGAEGALWREKLTTNPRTANPPMGQSAAAVVVRLRPIWWTPHCDRLKRSDCARAAPRSLRAPRLSAIRTAAAPVTP